MKRLIPFIFLPALSLFAQQPYQEKVDVNAVLVDAVVTDTHGNQILGLDRDDFIVKENGIPQNVESVDYFTNRRLLTEPEDQAKFKVERIREERYFIFFFDKPTDGQLLDQLTQTRAAAREFVEKTMLQTDRVAVVAHDVRLKVYSDFTSDKKQLIHALEEAGTFGPGITRAADSGNEPSILHNVDRDKMIKRSGTVYEGLEVLADSLRPIRARKEVILFSPGIHEPGEDVGPGGVLLNTSRYFQPMIEALNRANVTVYPVNIQREVGLAPVVHQTLERIAQATNGEYYRYMASYAPVVRQIESQTSGYYLLTYTTRHPAGTKGYQRIAVAVKNPEFRVKAREGYAYGE